MAEKPVVLGTAGGALGRGAFAAAVGGCCAAPWPVALLGVTGAVALARLTFLLPVPTAAALLHSPYVHHYWSANGEFGRLLSDSVDLKGTHGRVYAWDVWLLYGPNATWSGRGPPRPLLLVHQLSGLRGSTEFPHLDSRVFAEGALNLLAHLPAGEAAAPVTESRSR